MDILHLRPGLDVNTGMRGECVNVFSVRHELQHQDVLKHVVHLQPVHSVTVTPVQSRGKYEDGVVTSTVSEILLMSRSLLKALEFRSARKQQICWGMILFD